ncbi:hypothetical protein [Ramlibacter sp. AN1133]|uniref:hypothetical protein n=1 Tax=Ramlibacter sp. AN1133 TaxID=3133429 RepID=UPI0030C6140F
MISLQIHGGTGPRCMPRMYFGSFRAAPRTAACSRNCLISNGSAAAFGDGTTDALTLATPTENIMTALRTVLAFNGPMPAYETPAAIARIPGLLKNMALFLASPFIGLAYAVLLPFVGLGMLLWIAGEGMRKSRRVAVVHVEEPAAAEEAEAPAVHVEIAAEERQASGLAGAALLALKLLAAPFAGLAFVVAMPFVALGALAWAGMKAVSHRTA